MKETLDLIIQTSIVAVASSLVAAFIALIRFLAAKASSVIGEKNARDIEKEVTDAVKYTSQVYVDAIRKSGSPLSEEVQKKAFEKAKDAFNNAVSQKCKAYIAKKTVSVDKYIEMKIEAEVRRQKQPQPEE